ncbi:hypothetical protein F4677DRAFT_286881 [Hypoxylon crocopeplum]|nr:hypothetical protein F4677DRAFT_286881 [Hypoxylon crocopeplum]
MHRSWVQSPLGPEFCQFFALRSLIFILIYYNLHLFYFYTLYARPRGVTNECFGGHFMLAFYLIHAPELILSLIVLYSCVS